MSDGGRKMRPQGADIITGGVRYRIWAPERRQVEVRIQPSASGAARTLMLVMDADGYHAGVETLGVAGDRYQYVVDGNGPFPDPASRYQPEGVHGVSAVVDPHAYVWQDSGWKCPPLRDLVLYEIHVGTFTPEGTFSAAIGKLPYLRGLGINALQIMPVADFPGIRNWGYDGVSLFAPARCYGTPDDLRALVDAAHGLGIAVVQDVVYNHLGADGNYLGVYSRFYFNDEVHTPWGAALNYDGQQHMAVREYFLSNVAYWLDEFHFDGLRLDATHAILDASASHLLAEIADAAHQRGAFVIAEDERNLAAVIAPDGHGVDAVYADDFCHSIQVALGDNSYHEDFSGSAAELADELRHGWYYRGQLSKHLGALRGSAGDHLPPEKFAFCISNHDQVGNRAFGERLHQLTTPAAYRAASALLLLAPATPMLFMGQEWGAETPFQYFTNHNDELGRLVTEGRLKEFARFPEFRDPEIARTIPDPQCNETFLRSKLDWSELERSPHVELLDLHRECLRLRAGESALRPVSRSGWEVLDLGVVALRYFGQNCEWLVLAHFAPTALTVTLPEARWQCILSTNDTRFGGSGGAGFDPATGGVVFSQPELLVMQTTS
ncbi:MAG: malto-oligosyltrehalose trehalohydrolase [Verrucomicrobia bacterium 12-59-8]|nr:MAG: malto-oligosyltrehalose trehalohydrolase [Verrucomicrobia bacterium 12-59-8]